MIIDYVYIDSGWNKRTFIPFENRDYFIDALIRTMTLYRNNYSIDIKENPENSIIIEKRKFAYCTFYVRCTNYEDLWELGDKINRRKYLHETENNIKSKL